MPEMEGRGVGGLSMAGAPRGGILEARFSRQGARPLSLGSTSGRLRASVASVVGGQGLVRTGGLNFLSGRAIGSGRTGIAFLSATNASHSARR